MAACDINATVCIEQWSDVFTDLYERIARRFARTEVRERLRRYLCGLLDRVERKNGWQLAEAIGDADPQGVQRLLRTTRWDADGVRDDLRDYVFAHLRDEASGVLIVDETGFLKKGSKSCGVARQYTAPREIRSTLKWASSSPMPRSAGAAFIDRALYLPREWTGDRERRSEAGIPTASALRDENHARRADAGPGVRGGCPGAVGRRGLGLRALASLPAVAGETRARLRGDGPEDERDPLLRRARAGGATGARLTEDAWVSIAAGAGHRVNGCMTGPACRSPSAVRGGCAVGCSCGATPTTRMRTPTGSRTARRRRRSEELVRVCDMRWQIEECFAQAKGEVGMDHYEVRTWEAWHRFITLCLLAHALLVVLRAQARADAAGDGKKGMANPG